MPSKPMTVILKDKPLVVPPSVQRQAGIKSGDRVQFRASAAVLPSLPWSPLNINRPNPNWQRSVEAKPPSPEATPYH